VCVFLCVFFLVLPTSIHLQYPSHKRWGWSTVITKKDRRRQPKRSTLAGSSSGSKTMWPFQKRVLGRGGVHEKSRYHNHDTAATHFGEGYWRLSGGMETWFRSWELKMKTTWPKKGWKTSALTGNLDEIQEETSMKWAMGGCVFHYDFTLPLL